MVRLEAYMEAAEVTWQPEGIVSKELYEQTWTR